ncbi:MAG: glutamate 5-kinase [bacterium]
MYKQIQKAQRIVIKFGTNVLTNSDGNIALSRIYSFIEDIAKLKKQGKEIIIVTSGAVGLGAKKLKLNEIPNLVSIKQACAAVGQSKLMYFYEDGFDKFDIVTAQILLTEDDFSVREKYLSLRDTLSRLLELDVIPIINQNDTVSPNELRSYKDNETKVCFGDNDKLSALVTSELDADLLVILSDIDGLFDKDPRKNTDAKLIKEVKEITPEIDALGFEASKKGRGGMKTKLEAAKVVSRSGNYMVIANGKKPNAIANIFTENFVGTMFLPTETLSSKKRWIAYATNITGAIKVNDGAKKALEKDFSGLLPAGTTQIQNDFDRGDVVSIVDSDNIEFAKGVVNYSSIDCEKLLGQHSDNIEKILGYKNYDNIISRDNIVIL